jgi:hypothetical protein
MSVAETVRILLFVGVIVLIFVRAVAVVISYASGRRPMAWHAILFVALSGFGVTCIAYGYFVEPYWLDVTHVTVPTSKFSSGARPIRIVHISDLHTDGRTRLEGKLGSVIESEHPDAIVFTGDSINSPQGLPIFTALLKQLVAVAPTLRHQGKLGRMVLERCAIV